MWIDSHCHLIHRNNDDTPDEIIKRAKDNGVDGIQTICCRISEELDELNMTENIYSEESLENYLLENTSVEDLIIE